MMNSGDTRPTVRVDWSVLEAVFLDDADSSSSYLHVPTGEIARLPNHEARNLDPRAHLRITSVGSPEIFRWMEAFVTTVVDEALRASLEQALRRTGRFRVFKEMLAQQPYEATRWWQFRRARLLGVIELWFRRRGIEPDPSARTALVAPSREQLVQRLEHLCAALEPLDLQALVMTAEFLRSTTGREAAAE